MYVREYVRASSPYVPAWEVQLRCVRNMTSSIKYTALFLYKYRPAENRSHFLFNIVCIFCLVEPHFVPHPLYWSCMPCEWEKASVTWDICCILCPVDSQSRYNLVNKANLVHKFGETAVAKWWCCATNRKVVGSIPNGVIGIFRWHNPSSASNRNEYQKNFWG